MSIVAAGRGRPLGSGMMYPAGSLKDAELAAVLASYKQNVAGAYTSAAPDAIASTIPAGLHIASTKIDGEQWFLCRDVDGALLVSPNGKVITGVPVTEEADRVLSGWTGVLAGELYATVDTGRPRVFDLHSALGGGAGAQVDRLRFAAFDILTDGDRDCREVPFPDRAKRIAELLSSGRTVHPADFTEVDGAAGVKAFFAGRMDAGEEGIVVRCSDGRVFKVKPRVTIDAAVVAYTESASGIGEVLLALMSEPHTFHFIGRVDIGFSREERTELAQRLALSTCECALHLSSRSGLPYHWVRPEMVVEVACHELLTANSDGEPIRRWRITHGESGWQAIGKAASISMRDTVFLRVREDKTAALPDLRWSQVTDLVPLPAQTIDAADLLKSEVIRREVYTKAVRDCGVAVRKLVAWKTNKDDVDPRYPSYAAMFTDYSPARQDPIRTELRVASTIERIFSIAENWLAEHVRRGWDCAAKMGDVSSCPEQQDRPLRATGGSHSLTVSFARSTSPTFPIVRKRLNALAELGNLNVTTDDAGKEVWFELHVAGGLVENYRRIMNLLSLVRRWKTTEVALDGENLDKYAADNVLNRIEEIRQCWSRRKATGPAGCRRGCALGCRTICITPSQRFLEGAFITEPQWYGVGEYKSGCVIIDKPGLIAQADRRRNRLLDCCPCFDRNAILTAIQGLPDVLSPNEAGYQLVYKRDDGLAAWVWPEHAPLPSRLGARGAQPRNSQSGSEGTGVMISGVPARPTRPRQIPPATFGDVCGQEAAVEAVRDLIELPMKHGRLFEAVGVTAKPSGVILAGPPGTGKTLLARAVAGECGAHLETVSGPELLSPYVGATEQALREVFERAGKNTPSLILFDELDAIAPSRATADAHHQQSMVAQLLALLDGLESRAGVFVLATTNRPKSIDSALRRPGRFDRVVWMKLPDENGRAAILRHYLRPLKLDPSMDVDTLVADMSTATDGASGADLEYLCQTAARICVKEGMSRSALPDELAIGRKHFETALVSLDMPTTRCIVPVVTSGIREKRSERNLSGARSL